MRSCISTGTSTFLYARCTDVPHIVADDAYAAYVGKLKRGVFQREGNVLLLQLAAYALDRLYPAVDALQNAVIVIDTVVKLEDFQIGAELFGAENVVVLKDKVIAETSVKLCFRIRRVFVKSRKLLDQLAFVGGKILFGKDDSVFVGHFFVEASVMISEQAQKLFPFQPQISASSYLM